MDSYTKRQKQIIEVSIKLIAENGIQQLTIKNISKSIGISEPAIYRHFDNKMEILMAILSAFNESAKTTIERTGSSEGFSIHQIEFFFLDHFRQFVINPTLAAVIFSEEIFQNDKRLSEEVHSIMKLNHDALCDIIKKGQKSNELRSDLPKEQLSLIIMGSLRMIVTQWRLSNFSFDLKKEGIKLWKSIKKMIEVKPN